MTLSDAAPATVPDATGPAFTPRRLDELPAFEAPGARTLTVIMQKGGVGKTATTVGLADALAQQGVPAVVIDLCHTGMATSHLLKQPFLHELGEPYAAYTADLDANLASLMLGKWDGDIADLAIQRDENLWVVPCSAEMTTLAEDLVTAKFREERLVAALGDLPQRAVVLIDCPPVLNLVTDNALIACARKKKATGAEQQHGGIILCPELSEASLKTQDMLFQQCDALVKGTPYEIVPIGWFASETDDQRLIHRKARKILEESGLTRLGEMPVRTAIANARDAGKTLREYDSKTPRSRDALVIWDDLATKIREELHV